MGHTWASLRQSYWIVKGSVTVRRVIGNCVLCKKRNAPVGQQLMADLPLGRLQVNEPPFSHVGIDYFGPFLVKQSRRNLRLEDIVLIVDDSLPRSKWTIGRVVETFTDKHGLVRTVNVKTSTTVLKRPISKLCLILNSDEV